MTALKHDGGKPQLQLIPREAKEGLARVLEHGAAKYTRDNWRAGTAWTRFVGAAQRHLDAFNAGEDNDPESGLPHIDHAMACIAFLSTYQKTGAGTDDRWKGAAPSVSGNLSVGRNEDAREAQELRDWIARNHARLEGPEKTRKNKRK